MIRSYSWLFSLVWLGLPAFGKPKPKPAFLRPFAYSREVDGYYLVYRHHYFGLLDSTGRQIVPCRYDDIDRFHDGMAEVVLGHKHGYINRQGRLVIPLLYVRANPFQNGEALVVTPEGDVGYLNTQGQPVRPFNRMGRPYFRGRYAKGWALQPYVSRSIPRESVGEFYVALDAAVDYVPQQNPAVQPLRKTGLTVIFGGDKAYRRYGFADSSGRIVIPLVFEDADETQHAWKDWVRIRKHNRYGFLDPQSGRVVIPLQYEDSRPSAYNLVWVKQRGKWGCIGRTGNVVTPFQYTGVTAYSEGRAIVKRGNAFGYADTSGKLIVPLRFDQASYFRGGKAKVYQGHRWLELDRQGNVLDEGFQSTVFWKWVRYSVLTGGMLLFMLYVRRHKVSLWR